MVARARRQMTAIRSQRVSDRLGLVQKAGDEAAQARLRRRFPSTKKTRAPLLQPETVRLNSPAGKCTTPRRTIHVSTSTSTPRRGRDACLRRPNRTIESVDELGTDLAGRYKFTASSVATVGPQSPTPTWLPLNATDTMSSWRACSPPRPARRSRQRLVRS
jgi:hypothetical protein